MADTKVSALTELDAVPAVGDWIPFVDVSDTTHAASGTTKKINADRFIYTNGTANTLAANLDANNKNLTNIGTVSVGGTTTPAPLTVANGVNSEIANFQGGGRPLQILQGGGTATGIGWRSIIVGHNISLPSDNIPQVNGTTGYAKAYAIGFSSEDSTDKGMTFWTGGTDGADMTQRMVLTNAGRLGIGTASPATTLEVRGGITVSATEGTFTTAGWGKAMNFNSGATFFWAKGAGTAAHGFGATNGGIYIFRSSADDSSAAANYDFVITDTGDVGIGNAGPSYKLDVNGAAHASSFPTSSDRRLKENLQPVRNVLGKLGQLNAYTFTWKDEYRANDQFYEPDVDVPDSEFETEPTTEPTTEPITKRKQRQLGFVAQEVRKVFPELVTTWKHEYADDKYIRALAVDYGRMVPILVQGIKELADRGQALQARVTQLETDVEALRNRP